MQHIERQRKKIATCCRLDDDEGGDTHNPYSKDESLANRPPIGEQTIHKPVKPGNTEITMRCDTVDPAVLDLDLQARRRRWRTRSPRLPEKATDNYHDIRP